MEFCFDKKALSDRVALASRAANTSGGGPFVLSGVHITVDDDGVTFTGSDLDTTVRAHLRAESADFKPGVAVAPARLLADIVRNMPDGNVAVSLVQDDEMRIAAGRAEFNLRLLPANDYPAIEDHSNAPQVTLPAGDLAAAFRQASTASSTDDARPILTSVLMASRDDGMRLVSTDSYRLALRDLHGMKALEKDQSVLVPGQMLQDVSRLIGSAEEIVVRLADRHAVFEIPTDDGWIQVASRLVAGDFPSYEPLITDSTENTLTIDRLALLLSVRRLRLIGKENQSPLSMRLRPDGVSLSVVSKDIGEANDEINAEYDGEEIKVAFNPGYLIEGLESTDAETVTISRIDPLQPAVLRGADDEEYLYLLMPVRVN